MAISREQIDQFIRDQRAVFINDYKKIVEIPSISAQPEHKPDIQKCAELAASYLKSAGAEVKIFQTGGNPVVFGHIENKPGAPTVAIYNHLDVQPAEYGKDGWTMSPFQFTEKEGRFYSRGSTDDKGPAMTALWAAKIARELRIPLNIEFIWEMEEEIGSGHFEKFLSDAKSLIRADSILVSDTQWLSPDKPAVGRGLRGLVTMVVKLKTATHDVHSGTCGGIARNPVTELCWMMAECVDGKSGEIKIPGIEKTWTPPTEKDLDEAIETGFSVEKYKAAHKLLKMRSENPREVLKRIWLSPTFEVHSIAGGYQGAGVKTAIAPAAEAKISMRLVGNTDPQKVYQLVKEYLTKLNPDCEVELEGILEPYTAPKDNKLCRVASEAMEFGVGLKPVFIIEGGSIGAVVSMDRFLGKPIILLGLSLPQDNYHGPDESFAWTQVESGVRTFVKYFELMAASK